MNQQIEDRIEILKDYFDNLGNDLNSQKNSKWLFGFLVIYILMFDIFLLDSILISFSTIFHWTPLCEKWVKSGLHISLVFSMFFILQYSVIETLLSRHFKKIEGKAIPFDDKLNAELENILIVVSKKRFKPYYIKIPAFAVAIIGLVQSMNVELFSKTDSISSLWSWFPTPTLFAGILLLWYANNQIWMIWKNLKAVETLI